MKRRSLFVLVAGILLAACSKPSGESAQTAANAPGAAPAAAPAAEEPVLNVYNWSDYIAPDTLDKFTKETGIKVTYDVFDSNEILEAKLVAGNTGYDVVVPSLNFLARQVKAGVFMPLDKSKLTNWGNLDPENLARIAVNDPGNAYAAPYLWGTTGIGYNVQKVQKIFGKDFKVDSWDLVFKPENLSKLKGCGVSFLDSPSEIIPPILNWLGEDPHSEDPAVIKKAEDVLLKIRPYITNFHSSNYIDYLANGDICIAVGWSGDIFIAKSRAEEAKKGVEIAYSIPKEGAPMWFDMLAIPKDAKHPDNAHKFINFLMRPDVMAGITNYVTYANSNKASYDMVDEEVRNNPGVYPSEETRKKLFPLAVLSPDVDRLYTRIWTTVKTGK